MESISRVPQEMVKIIPVFSGDARTLPLYIKKCEYILTTFQGSVAQNAYLFHVVTSRLSGEAASLVGERDSIDTWDELKKLLNQHFGDPRTEDCLAMELESCRINKGESYLDFCHRLQHMRSALFAKISETIMDDSLRKAKQIIYSNRAMNVFLFNLPPFLVRLVRLRDITTLEDALKIVLEEQNFQSVYDSKTNDRRNFNRTNRPNLSNFNSQTFSSFNNQNVSNFNSHINDSHRISSTHVPNNATNSTFTPNNSHQFRNFKQHNNNQYNFNRRFNNNSSPQLTRSPFPIAQSSQQFATHAPRMAPFATQASTSGSNTDVTMRTASSRRVNYINNYSNNEQNTSNMNNECQEFSPEDAETENFCIMASTLENE